MPISWNEIKDRAYAFSAEWADTTREEADAQPFLDAFFHVFNISRRKIGTFEHKVKKLDDANGYIDLLWKGVILIEMKSRGQNLNKAHQQAIDYTHGLKAHDLPKYILVCDFHEFRLFDTEEQTTQSFTIDQFAANVAHFGFIAGYVKKTYKEQDPVNIKAAELMGKLHDQLKAIGFDGHPLEVYLVRLLFCLFAEDSQIFEKQQFQDYIEQRTAIDGSDLAAKISELFQTLNTPMDKRFKNLDEQLAAFPYVNGKLFEETLPTASFDSKMRQALLECCYIDWSQISPAIFGSMFQSVMNPIERRNLGAHYTSELNILKLIKPLFLDDLWAQFEAIKRHKPKLIEFHQRLASLKFLDPACGCGNFLIITYRELRLLELEILKQLYNKDQLLDIDTMALLNVDMMLGIEYEEFPARIAEVAMWLIDHQMNMRLSAEFGQYYARLPLRRAAQITHGDALAVDWHDVIPNTELSYILGNPPFIGAKIMTQPQRDAIVREFNQMQGAGTLDYVTGWYIKAAKYIQHTPIKAAFVSTNSIVQGEQVALLWGQMMNQYGINIHFAHRTFKWSNEAKGNAAVYCVIIGFAHIDSASKTIFEYENIKGETHAIAAKHINAYLTDAPTIFVEKRTKPLSLDTPTLIRGSIPYDDGHLLLNEAEASEIQRNEPDLKPYIKRYGAAYELINNNWRYCFWLVDAPPSVLRSSPKIKQVAERVQQFRLASKGSSVKSKASTPTLFGDIRQPKSDNYLMFPRVSSERRQFIPIGFIDQSTILGDSAYGVPNATLYHFGILTSLMHMAWVKTICGRLKSDYRYSASIVYNNYPWPENPADKHRANIETAAQAVLDARAAHPTCSLADLYDPLTMPVNLVQAHAKLDKAVDAAYTFKGTSHVERVAFLFALYQAHTNQLIQDTPIKPKRRPKSTA